MSARSPLPILLTVLALALAACGGDGGGGNPAPPAGPTKADVVGQADKICADAQAEATAIKRPRGRRPAAVRAYVEKVAAVQEKAVADIRALKPPPEGKADFDRFVRANEELTQSFDGLVEAVEDKDPKAFARVNRRIQKSSADAQKAAQAYGFKTCGRTQTATG